MFKAYYLVSYLVKEFDMERSQMVRHWSRNKFPSCCSSNRRIISYGCVPLTEDFLLAVHRCILTYLFHPREIGWAIAIYLLMKRTENS